jgi:hypothetical protein
MANTVAASVRRFDEAWVRGHDAMQEQKPTKSVIAGDGKLS